MFNNSKYTKLYFQIIERARERDLQEGFEKHHVIPRSLGGTNDEDNIVRLTFKEHYCCHHLLTKMCDGDLRTPLLFALWAMSNQRGEYRSQRNYIVSARLYETLRLDAISLLKKTNTGRKYPNRKRPTMSEEQRQQRRERLIQLNKSRKGRVLSEETKEKIRKKRALQDVSHLKGKQRSEGTKAKIKAKRALQTNVRNQYSASQPKSP